MSTKTLLAIALTVSFGSMAATAIAQGDWEQYRDQVRVKKVIADKLTPEQYEAHVDKMARFIAAQRQQAATPKIDDGIRAPGDTCVAATPEISSLPFNTAGTTVGATDDFDLPPDTADPTCTAAVTCTGTGPVGSLPRGAIYTGSGTGPDTAYSIQTSANCDLNIEMTSTTEDLGLTLFLGQCSSSLADCGCASDTGFGGDTETIALSAVAGTQYFVVIDGYSTGGTPPGPSDTFDLDITQTSGSCTLVPVELQNFSID